MTTATIPADTTELTGTYNIDPSHSRFGFVARHAMVTKVRGGFNEFEGAIEVDGDDPTKSSAQIVIQTKSIDTRNADRDEHLKSNDFFAMDEYPELTFTSKGIEKVDKTNYRVTGDLTIRGVTKEISTDVEVTGTAVDPFGNLRVGFEGAVAVNRKDWGVNWNATLETGGVLVSEKVTLEFEISAIKAS